jgi:cytosine/adenosine deaminase-related metal-dependent hydrolase
VRVVGSEIDAVGAHAELLAAYPDDAVVRAGDAVVAPGFVNAHTHLYGTLAHGIPLHTAPSGFWSFLDDFWWPKVEDSLDHAMITAATAWVCAEMLRSGTTTFYDILEAPNAVPGALLAEKEVVDRFGLRGILSFEATERVSAANGRTGLAENVALIQACRADPASLVSGFVCYHTTFTCSPAFIQAAFALAEEHDVLCHAHCNEGVHEGEWCEQHHGMRTVEFYDRLGVLGPRFLASQCVQLSERERELLAERGVRVSHMPLANCEVGGGIAPVPELLDAGVTVGLGSDGYVNDAYEVMRGAFLLHKARRLDPGAMPAGRVFHAATAGGAEALGLARVGRLEPGWAADLQVVDARFPTPLTEHNLLDQLVLYRNHSHVRDVMVAGQWRVRGGEVLGHDLDDLRAATQHQAERLWSRA